MSEAYITHGTWFTSHMNMHPDGTLRGKQQLFSWCHRRSTHRSLCKLAHSHRALTHPTASGAKHSPFSQPPLPAPFFPSSKWGGLPWRAPYNLCLTISIWQLLWMPAARWKGQKPWLCWGFPREGYVNKAWVCSLLHLTLFSHSYLDLRWN